MYKEFTHCMQFDSGNIQENINKIVDEVIVIYIVVYWGIGAIVVQVHITQPLWSS